MTLNEIPVKGAQSGTSHKTIATSVPADLFDTIRRDYGHINWSALTRQFLIDTVERFKADPSLVPARPAKPAAKSPKTGKSAAKTA